MVVDLVKKTVRPEFLNRIDETIMFTPLDKNEIRQIVSLQLNSIKKMLKENNIKIDFTEKAIDFIVNEGYDPQFGARPIKRTIQRYILNDLSKAILAQNISNEDLIVVDCENDSLVFKNK